MATLQAIKKLRGWQGLTGDDYLNIWGIHPFRTIFTRVIGGYDLSIIHHDNGKYSFAHGSIVEAGQYETAMDAGKMAIKWYYNNRQPLHVDIIKGQYCF